MTQLDDLKAVAADMLAIAPNTTLGKLDDIARLLDEVDVEQGTVGQDDMQQDLRGWASKLRLILGSG